MKNLKVGDKVMWRGAWGQEPPKEAVIETMELCAVNSKYGYKEIKQAKWETVHACKVIVTLTNGHWAYGNQLDPIK